MTFIHEDPEFFDLLGVVSAQRGIGLALVEKDYWVTHTLWALLAQGFELWFKGGTSLSKGFGLIERFSEDLDLKIEPLSRGAADQQPMRMRRDPLDDLAHEPLGASPGSRTQDGAVLGSVLACPLGGHRGGCLAPYGLERERSLTLFG